MELERKFASHEFILSRLGSSYLSIFRGASHTFRETSHSSRDIILAGTISIFPVHSRVISARGGARRHADAQRDRRYASGRENEGRESFPDNVLVARRSHDRSKQAGARCGRAAWCPARALHVSSRYTFVRSIQPKREKRVRSSRPGEDGVGETLAVAFRNLTFPFCPLSLAARPLPPATRAFFLSPPPPPRRALRSNTHDSSENRRPARDCHIFLCLPDHRLAVRLSRRSPGSRT